MHPRAGNTTTAPHTASPRRLIARFAPAVLLTPLDPSQDARGPGSVGVVVAKDAPQAGKALLSEGAGGR